eukprot:6183036-Pleurochrysis_carterae.AAC.1
MPTGESPYIHASVSLSRSLVGVCMRLSRRRWAAPTQPPRTTARTRRNAFLHAPSPAILAFAAQTYGVRAGHRPSE